MIPQRLLCNGRSQRCLWWGDVTLFCAFPMLPPDVPQTCVPVDQQTNDHQRPRTATAHQQTDMSWVGATLLCKQWVALRVRCLGPVISSHTPLWGNRWGLESEDGIASRICLCCVAGTSLALFDFRGKPKIFCLSPSRGRAVCGRGLRRSDEDIFREWNTKCSSLGAKICAEINLNIPHRVDVQQQSCKPDSRGCGWLEKQPWHSPDVYQCVNNSR